MAEERPPVAALQRAQCAIGTFTALAGAVVLAGWHARQDGWVQIHPGLAPMQYNVALLFVAGGLAMVVLLWSRRRLEAAAGVLLAGTGTLTLAQYLLGLDLGLDALFMEPYLAVGTSQPGRMAPNTAVCFVLLGFFLLLARRGGSGETVVSARIALGSAVTALGGVALLGYVAGIENAYGWGGWTRMAVHTSFNFLLLGTGALIYTWARHGLPGWLAVPVSLTGVLTTILIWQALGLDEEKRFRETLQIETQHLATQIAGVLDPKIRALQRLAARWELAGGLDRERWESDAALYVKHVQGLELVQRLDHLLEHPWTVSREGRSMPAAVRGLIRGITQGLPLTARGVDLSDGARGLAVILRLEDEASPGFMVGLFNLQTVLHPSLSPNVWASYQFSVMENGNQLYAWFHSREPELLAWMEQLNVEVLGARWHLELWPSPVLLARERPQLPLLVLVAGLTVSGLLGLALTLGQNASRRAAEAEAVAHRLGQEILEHNAAEEALRESQARYQDLYDNAPDMFLSVEARGGTVIQCNETLLRVTGYAREELLGRSVFDLYEPGCLPEAMAMAGSFLRSGSIERTEDLQLLCKDGRVIDIAANTSAVRGPEGEILYSRSIWRDTTERKRAKRLLQGANDRLEERVKKRTAELENLNQELERSNQELVQFAYVASHDLQEPLRKIISYTQLLSQRYGDRLDDKARRFISYAVDGALRMRKLINDLLSYSRVNTQARERVSVEATLALERAISNLQLSIQESGARVIHDPLPRVMADETQLTQLFQNLIANALKYRGEETPRIHVGFADREDGYEFSVRDNGIGIDPVYGERIFVIFQRLHTRDEYPGTGIGLALCKRIVERHGGRIWVESRPGAGSTFFFTLRKAGAHAGPKERVAVGNLAG